MVANKFLDAGKTKIIGFGIMFDSGIDLLKIKPDQVHSVGELRCDQGIFRISRHW